MVGARAYDYIKPLQIASLLWVGANAHPYNSEVGASLHCINFGWATDPACGTSGFLVAAGEYLKENKNDEIFFDKQKKDHYMNHMFHGYDMDRTMVERIMCGSMI